MYLLLVNGIVFLLRKKWYGLWIENVHSTIINHKSYHRQVKKPIYFADHQLSKKRIFHRIFFNDWVEEIIIRKDYKMLMRARKKSIIAFWLWSFNSIFFGLISLAIGYAEDAPIGMLYTINLLLINIMVIIFLMIIYHLKDFTWYSSEGRASFLYTQTKVDLYDVLKAKIKLNKLLILPVYLPYTLLSFGLIFTFKADVFLYLLFSSIYAYSIMSLLLKYILHKDISKPRMSGAYDWIGYSSVMHIVFILLFIPFTFWMIFTDEIADHSVLAFTIGILILIIIGILQDIVHRRIHRLKGIYDWRQL